MGIDRIVALLAGRDNIREVIAFPKATSGGDPLTGAPAPVDADPAARAGIPAEVRTATDASGRAGVRASPDLAPGPGPTAAGRATRSPGGRLRAVTRSPCLVAVDGDAGHRRRFRRPRLWRGDGRRQRRGHARARRRPARRGADRPGADRRRARRAEPGQAARRRAGGRRAGTGARGGGVRAGAPSWTDGGATLVAMSGGVDSAVAAHLCAHDGETMAVTLELWADPENDAERSCCSASAVAQARSLAHSMGLPHFTIDLRQEFRAGVVEPFIAGYAAGETPNPCVGCNGHVRLDAMLELADRLGCAAPGHRPLRPHRRARRRSRGPAAARRCRPRQGPDLHAGGAGAGVAGADALPARRPAQAPGAGDRRRGRSAGRRQGRLPGPVLPGRHLPGALPGAPRGARRPRRADRRRGRRRARYTTSDSTASPSVSGAGSVSTPAEPLYVLDKDRRHRHGHRRPPVAAARPTRVAIRAARLHRTGAPGRQRQAALPPAAAAGAPGRGPGRRASPRAGDRARRTPSTAPRRVSSRA